jgi:hypothetical protein
MSDPAPEVKDAISLVLNRRTDAMFVAAYCMVAGLAYVVIFVTTISQYAQGVITLVLGNFIGYLTAMYQFETGTTRASAAKDLTIKSMAEAAPIATAAAVAATVAAEAAKTAPSPPIPLVSSTPPEVSP